MHSQSNYSKFKFLRNKKKNSYLHINDIVSQQTLIENGEMLLADGRRILPRGVRCDTKESDIVRLHPDFRMIVLANRPGFPFLGNDFFASLGAYH